MDELLGKTKNRLVAAMQLRAIFFLVIYFGQGKKTICLQPWIEKRKGSCFCLCKLFIESVFFVSTYFLFSSEYQLPLMFIEFCGFPH